MCISRHHHYCYYRKWTKELDDAIQELQHSMELECDNYFEVIKPKAIKVTPMQPQSSYNDIDCTFHQNTVFLQRLQSKD